MSSDHNHDHGSSQLYYRRKYQKYRTKYRMIVGGRNTAVILPDLKLYYDIPVPDGIQKSQEKYFKYFYLTTIPESLASTLLYYQVYDAHDTNIETLFTQGFGYYASFNTEKITVPGHVFKFNTSFRDHNKQSIQQEYHNWATAKQYISEVIPHYYCEPFPTTITNQLVLCMQYVGNSLYNLRNLHWFGGYGQGIWTQDMDIIKREFVKTIKYLADQRWHQTDMHMGNFCYLPNHTTQNGMVYCIDIDACRPISPDSVPAWHDWSSPSAWASEYIEAFYQAKKPKPGFNIPARVIISPPSE